jgi:hypothetical protein
MDNPVNIRNLFEIALHKFNAMETNHPDEIKAILASILKIIVDSISKPSKHPPTSPCAAIEDLSKHLNIDVGKYVRRILGDLLLLVIKCDNMPIAYETIDAFVKFRFAIPNVIFNEALKRKNQLLVRKLQCDSEICGLFRDKEEHVKHLENAPEALVADIWSYYVKLSLEERDAILVVACKNDWTHMVCDILETNPWPNFTKRALIDGLSHAIINRNIGALKVLINHYNLHYNEIGLETYKTWDIKACESKLKDIISQCVSDFGYLSNECIAYALSVALAIRSEKIRK